jgi:cellulose biosynthesis protein BcsQ
LDPAEAFVIEAQPISPRAGGKMTATARRPKRAPTKSRSGRNNKIAFFNHKEGVSKTTTTFNLGWMLAAKGHRVVLVDADPQCNLSSLVLGYKGPKEFEIFYEKQPERNIRAGLAPAFESRPRVIEAIECVPVEGNPNLFLLPGHIGLGEYEVSLGMAQQLSAMIQTLQNLPGSLSYLVEKTGKKYDAEYVLIDMSPSLSSINQNLVMTSDFFLVPASPDYFSVMAIDSLTTVLPRWRAWSKAANSTQAFRDAVYPFPETVPKFLGTIIQEYNMIKCAEKNEHRGDSRSRSVPARAFQKWIDEVNRSVKSKFVPMLRQNEMLLDEERYRGVGIADDYCLKRISDFNGLIAKSQNDQAPVFSLTQEPIGLEGRALTNTEHSRSRSEQDFSELADMIVELTSDAAGS